MRKQQYNSSQFLALDVPVEFRDAIFARTSFAINCNPFSIDSASTSNKFCWNQSNLNIRSQVNLDKRLVDKVGFGSLIPSGLPTSSRSPQHHRNLVQRLVCMLCLSRVPFGNGVGKFALSFFRFF